MRILLLILAMFSPLNAFSDQRINRMFQPDAQERDAAAETDAGEQYFRRVVQVFAANPAAARFVLEYPLYCGAEITFDLSGEVTKGEIPLFLQWDRRWGYQIYGSGFLAMTGCGPTCLSMVYCGLTGDASWDPGRMARFSTDSGYYVWGSGTAWDLMSRGARRLGLTTWEISIDSAQAAEALRAGRVIICSMRPGDFTKRGHFIVLTGIDDEGKVHVCDPNSEKNSKKAWDIERVMSQVKGIWAYSYEG